MKKNIAVAIACMVTCTVFCLSSFAKSEIVVVNLSDKKWTHSSYKDVRLEFVEKYLVVPMCSKNTPEQQREYFQSSYNGPMDNVLYCRISDENLACSIGSTGHFVLIHNDGKPDEQYSVEIKEEFLNKDKTKMTLMFPNDFTKVQELVSEESVKTSIL